MSIVFYKSRPVAKYDPIDVYLKVDLDLGIWRFWYDENSVDGRTLSSDPDREMMQLLLEALQWCYSERKRCVNFHTDNIFIYNLLNDWIIKWEKTNFKLLPIGETLNDNYPDRPNSDLLRQLAEFRRKVIYQVKYVSTIVKSTTL